MFDNLEPNQDSQKTAPTPARPAGVFPPQAKPDDIFAGVKEVGLPKSKNGFNASAPLKVENRPRGFENTILKVLIILIIVLILVIAGLVIANRYFGFSGLSQFLSKTEKTVPVQNPIIETPAAEIDTDGDGLADVYEKEIGTDPLKAEEYDASNLNGNTEYDLPNTNSGSPDEIKKITNEGSSTSSDVLVVNPVVSTTTQTGGNPITGTEIDSMDTDGDGLSDKQELLIGTNPNKADTDSDGLLDAEEVNIFKTNPLKVDSDNDELSDFDEVKKYLTDPNNPDTDADTYLDGVEVKGGYNPKGPGKLQIPL